jgi:hypothetical protein
MNIQIIRSLPMITDLFWGDEQLTKKWFLGIALTYFISPVVLWLYIVEFNLIMPTGVESPLLRLFFEITGWVWISGVLSVPFKIFTSNKFSTIFHIVLLFSIPLLIWKSII